MKILTSLLVLLFVLISLLSNAQTLQTIRNLEDKHQICLDTGKNMLGCSRKFFLQMDSLLNVVYNKLRRTLNESEKTALKQAQLNWLTKRDVYFDQRNKELQKKYVSGMGGQDEAMFVYEEEADFVKERIIALIHLLSPVKRK